MVKTLVRFTMLVLMLLGVVQLVEAQGQIFRCADNEYIRGADIAQERGCKLIEGGTVRIVPALRDPAPAPARPSVPDSTGSGFRIANGVFVTNHHVVDGCNRLRVNGRAAQVQRSDPRSDLAQFSADVPGPIARLRGQRVGIGEAVAVAGFPLRGLLSGFNMTTGTISSMSGLGGDTRYFQITAPVQPGNSGGPMLDSAGNLAGVVVAKLDAIKVARATGDIPQNVNFAINTNTLRSFVSDHSTPSFP